MQLLEDCVQCLRSCTLGTCTFVAPTTTVAAQRITRGMDAFGHAVISVDIALDMAPSSRPACTTFFAAHVA